MKHEGQLSTFTVVSGSFVPLSDPRAADAGDEPRQDPSDLWESTVDLAKQLDLLGRLNALLNL